jgi:hypothetical protein
MKSATRRADRLRRAPKIVMGNDNSEPIADRHELQRPLIDSLTVYDGLTQIGRIEVASAGTAAIAFAADGNRLGEFPNEAAAMRALTNLATSKERLG